MKLYYGGKFLLHRKAQSYHTLILKSYFRALCVVVLSCLTAVFEDQYTRINLKLLTLVLVKYVKQTLHNFYSNDCFFI